MRTRLSLVCTIAALLAGQAQTACRQALALGLDVSGSVDAREYRLQIDGLAAALEDPRVSNALLDWPDRPVALLVYEWSGPDDQSLIQPWLDLRTEADLMDVIARLRETERRLASPGTALGTAMQIGAAFLQRRKDCETLTLDLSGDGRSNLGPLPQDIRRGLARQNITINGLVVGVNAPPEGDLRQDDLGELTAYFEKNVILGENAFVETARGYKDYLDAMTRKLMREIETVTVSQLSR